MRVVLVALLACKSTAFFSGSLIVRGLSSPKANVLEEARRTCELAAGSPAEQQDATDENDPGSSDAHEVEMANSELEKLIGGFEHGSSRDSPRGRAGRRGDMDEMKMIMLLRQQMGEEDFYEVFDPRNPRIGDI